MHRQKGDEGRGRKPQPWPARKDQADDAVGQDDEERAQRDGEKTQKDELPARQAKHGAGEKIV